MYVYRLFYFSDCSERSMAAMYVYLSELMNQFWNKGIALLTEFTVHRLVLAALVLAIKFYEDFYMDNKEEAIFF